MFPTVKGINPDFLFVANLVLPQRRSIGTMSMAMNRGGVNGIALAGSFLPGVGQFVTIHCNYDGKRLVEEYFGSTITWMIQPKD